MDDAAATSEWRDDASDEFATDAKTRHDPDKPVELGFLLQLRDNPEDLAMRMVFADWLEQTAQNDKAETVRLLAEVPVEGSSTMKRLRLLCTTLDRDWMAIVSRAPIDKCPTTNLQFRYQCPQSWESLTSTDDATIRFCNQCQKHVYFCSSLQEVRSNASDNRCVAFSPAIARHHALQAYDEGEEIMMGDVSPPDWEDVTNPGVDAAPPGSPTSLVAPDEWDEETNPY